MNILLFSDTHGNAQGMIDIIEKYVTVDLIIHLGDYVKDVERVRNRFSKLQFEYVAGNNDWSVAQPPEKLLELSDKKIFITHGHTYGVKSSVKSLIKKGRDLQADAIFFGHTHFVDEFFHEQMLVLNPGSFGRCSMIADPSFCEIKIDQGKIVSSLKKVSVN